MRRRTIHTIIQLKHSLPEPGAELWCFALILDQNCQMSPWSGYAKVKSHKKREKHFFSEGGEGMGQS